MPTAGWRTRSKEGRSGGDARAGANCARRSSAAGAERGAPGSDSRGAADSGAARQRSARARFPLPHRGHDLVRGRRQDHRFRLLHQARPARRRLPLHPALLAERRLGGREGNLGLPGPPYRRRHANPDRAGAFRRLPSARIRTATATSRGRPRRGGPHARRGAHRARRRRASPARSPALTPATRPAGR